MKIKRDLLIILILFFIGICFGHIQSFGYYHYSDGVTSPGQMAVEFTYDEVKNWEYDSNDNQFKYYGSSYQDGAMTYGVANSVCMHSVNNDGMFNKGVDKTVFAVITIDEYGNCTVTCKGHTEAKEIDVGTDGAKYARALAYLSTAYDKVTKKKNGTVNSPNYYYYYDFHYVWNKFCKYSDINTIVGNVTCKSDGGFDATTGHTTGDPTYYDDAMDYATNYKNYSERYVAKIFLVKSGQSRAVIFGEKTDSTPNLSIKKYISKTKLQGKIDGRDDMNGSKKSADPLKVVPDDIVTFTIIITNKGGSEAEDVKIEDSFNSNYLTYNRENNKDFGWTGEGSTVSQKITVGAGGTKTLNLKLTVNSNCKWLVKTTNTATLTYGDDSSFSKDYIIVDPELTINKYIYEVEYPNGVVVRNSKLGRSDYIETKKSSNPVNVVPGAIITYKIEVTTELECELIICDKYSSHLKISDASEWDEQSDGTYEISYSGKKATYTIKFEMQDVKPYNETETSYGNRAYVYGMSTKEGYYSKDYVKCDYTDTTDQDSATLEIVNYISKIEKPDGTIQNFENSRSDYSNEMAGAYPVVVEKGDKVTYTIEVTNNYEENFGNEKSHRSNPDTATIKNVWVTVSWSAGLQYGSSSDDNKSIRVGKKDEEIKPNDTASSTITLTVTKSDMYLYTLVNEISFDSGFFNQETIYYRRFKAPDENYYTYEYTKRSREYANIIGSESVTDENTEDFIQLDDVEIAGNVWLDSNENGLMDSQENGFQDVHVYLYKNGEICKTEGQENDYINVDENGHYTFGRMVKGNTKYSSSKYPNATRKYADTSGYNSYTIVFEYNGVLYEPTEYVDGSYVTDSGYIDPYKDWDSRSHANENESDRIAFNNSFETVAYDKAYSGTSSSSNKKTLSYTKDGHISTIDWDASTTMEASSFDLYLNYGDDEGTGTSKVDYVDYLKHMNLGLVERGQADLSASKDLVEVYTTVNGSETTYIYNYSSDGELEEYYRSDPYALKIYNEDYSYRTSNYDSTILEILGYTNENADQNDLQVRLTYKIMLSNDSVKEYYGVIREVIDIYSDSLELDRVYDSTGEWNNQPHNTSSYNEDSYNYDGYTTCFITGSELETVLAPGDTKEFYIDYSLKKNNGSIILDEERNIAQIGAFSIYDNENKTTPSGVVDGDANPGNVIIYGSLDDYESYEDNIYSTSIDISLRGDQGEEPPGGEPEPEDDPPPTPDPKQDPGDEYRVISGNVWEDLIITDEINEGELVGNGYKDEDEEWAENITVYLYESITGNDGNEYLVYSGISTSTDSDGNYYLYDKDKLHAGNYKVRFIYGNDKDTLLTDDGGDTIKFSGQDYKSTLYTDVKSVVDEDQLIYGSEFEKFYKNNGETIYSEAKDNELRRLEVIDYSTTMTYKLDDILKDKSSSDLVKNTYMFADTRTFIVTIEDYNNYSNPPENFIYTKTAIFKDSYMENKIGNINFGLITRPQTKLVGTKDISRITAITSDGNPLVDLNFDIYYFTDDEGDFSHVTQLNEEESQGYKNVQILDRSRKSTSNQGFRYINIDSILMQGMTIIVEYQVGIGNTSDIDLENENLINIVENYDLGNVVDSFKDYLGELVSMGHTYGEDASNINKTLVYSSISNINLDNVIETFESEYPEYKIDGSYSSGYFLGDTYYTGEYDAEHEKVVPTRIDQIIDYVDTDLVLDLSENTNEKGEGKFINYTADQIYNYGLLADINEETSNEEITDGVSSYIVEDSEGTVIKNNLAFNVESEEVNPTLYKFLPPLSTVDEETTTPATYIDVDELNSSNTTEKYVTYEDKDGNEQQVNAYNYDDLYVITLNASRTLSSEQDADGLSIDNVSEIVKVTNTAGRKVYVLNQGTTNDVGHIGNSFKDVRRMYSDEEDDEDITIKTVVGETDTDYTEFITFSPPTGLGLEKENEHRIVGAIFGITITLCVVAGGLTVIIYKSTRKKFYR